MAGKLLRWLIHSILANIVSVREAIQAFSFSSCEDSLKSGPIHRPRYGRCLFEAAKLAMRVRYPKMCAIEFACGAATAF
jgi:hypothetical protein